MPNTKRHWFPVYPFFALIYVICAIYAMMFYFQNSASLGDGMSRGRLDRMVEGTAHKPFVYRQLVPNLVRSIEAVTPEPLRTAVSGAMQNYKVSMPYYLMKPYMPWFENIFPSEDSHYRRILASLVIFGFLIGYLAGIFALARALFPGSPAVALFAPIFAVVAYSSFGVPFQFIYDLATLCLSTACFYFIYTERHRCYLLVFFLSCLNKETAIFSILFFALWNAGRMEKKRFLTLWTLQCFLYILVKCMLTITYMNNPGELLERHADIIIKHDLLAAASIFKVITVMVLWFLLTYRWDDKPMFLKCSLWILPLIYLAYLLYGSPGEYRVFFDMHAPLVLLATHTLVVGTGVAASPLFSVSNLGWKKNL